jgi:hypothetical protein
MGYELSLYVHRRLILVFKWIGIGNVNAETTTLVNPSANDTTGSAASDYIHYVMSHASDYGCVVMISSADKCVKY